VNVFWLLFIIKWDMLIFSKTWSALFFWPINSVEYRLLVCLVKLILHSVLFGTKKKFFNNFPTSRDICHSCAILGYSDVMFLTNSTLPPSLKNRAMSDQHQTEIYKHLGVALEPLISYLIPNINFIVALTKVMKDDGR